MNSPYKPGRPTKYNPTTGAGTKPPAKPGEYRIRQAGMLSSRAYGLLEAAKTRVELNWRAIPAEFKEELGLSGSNGGRIDLSEYLLWLQMKQKRGDLADFLRGCLSCCGLHRRRRRGFPCPSTATRGASAGTG